MKILLKVKAGDAQRKILSFIYLSGQKPLKAKMKRGRFVFRFFELKSKLIICILFNCLFHETSVENETRHKLKKAL